MSLRVKLATAISMFILILTMLVVGVLSLSPANIPMGGSVSFAATDVYAKVSAKIENAQGNPTVPDIYFSANAEDASSQEDIEKWGNLNLIFNSAANPIEIEITIENLSTERGFTATVVNEIESLENFKVTITNEGEEKSSANVAAKPQEGTSLTKFNVKFEVKDPNYSVDETYGILISLTDTGNLKQINVHSNLPEGLVEGDGLYNIGDTVTLKAFLPEDYSVLPLAFSDDSNYENFIFKDNVAIENKTFIEYSFTVEKNSPTDYYAFFIPWGTMSDYIYLDTNVSPFSYVLIGDVAFAGLYGYVLQGQVPTTLQDTHLDFPNNVSIEQTDGQIKNYRVIGYINNEIDTLSTIYPNLESINIPENFEFMVGRNMMFLCDGVEQITISENNKNLSDMGSNVIYDKLNKTVVAGCPTSIIPEEAEVIGEGAFFDTAITNINITKNIVKICDSAFYSSDLTQISFEDESSLTYIGHNAFGGINITQIILPSNLTVIDEDAFFGCSSLTSITLPSSLITIGDCAFSYCSSLTQIVVEKGSSLTTSFSDIGLSGTWYKDGVQVTEINGAGTYTKQVN